MRIANLSPILAAALVSISCGAAPQPADLVLTNGFVFTADPAKPRAEAVAVAGNRIVAVGSAVEIKKYIREGTTRVVDLEGRLMTPGFNDAHAHIISVGAALERLDLTGVDSFEEFARMVKERARISQPGEWIVGRGWDQSLLPGKAWPTKELIDSVSPENPVVLNRADSHSRLLNSLALQLSGITKETPDPDGGEIVRDPVTGEPTGILKENAMGLVRQPRTESREENERTQARHLNLALEQARRLGVTSVTHFNGDERYFEQALEAGELTFRVNVGHPLTDDPEKLAGYSSLREKYCGNEMITFGPLKGFIDGTLGSGTAAMFEPYADAPSTSGTLVTTVEEMERWIMAAERDSFQVAIHAIGDRGSNIILNIVEKAQAEYGPRDHRHRIEHAQILTPGDIPRFASLGVIPSMQPSHCITDKRFAEDRLGMERCRWSYAWNSLSLAGARPAFGTDCPIEPLDPMEGLYAAVSRKDRRGEPGPGWVPEEKISMEQAIGFYTLGSAYAEFQEDRKGSITPGKLADMVVLSQNLFEIPESGIMRTKVDYTVFDGRIVYERDAGR